MPYNANGQTLRHVAAILAEAGGKPAHLVHLTWLVTDKTEYLLRLKELGAAHFTKGRRRRFPAMSLAQVVAPTEDPARVESGE